MKWKKKGKKKGVNDLSFGRRMTRRFGPMPLSNRAHYVPVMSVVLAMKVVAGLSAKSHSVLKSRTNRTPNILLLRVVVCSPWAKLTAQAKLMLK